jgi:hypothetical protein
MDRDGNVIEADLSATVTAVAPQIAAAVPQVCSASREAIVRTCRDAGWPTPTRITASSSPALTSRARSR